VAKLASNIFLPTGAAPEPVALLPTRTRPFVYIISLMAGDGGTSSSSPGLRVDLEERS
jgi:hypothetical protein